MSRRKRKQQQRRQARNQQNTKPTQAQSPPPPPNETPSIVEDTHPPSGDEPERKQDHNEPDRKFGWRGRVSIDRWFAGAVGLSTIFQGVYSGLQWAEMRDQTAITIQQLAEMKGQDEFNKSQLAAMQAQSDATVAQSKTMREQLDAMVKSIAVAEAANAVAKTSADAAVVAANAAKDGNALYHESNVIALRAYLMLGTCTLSVDSANSLITANLEVRNAGVTPADKITMHVCAFIEKPDFAGPWDLTQSVPIEGQEMSAGPDRAWTITVKPRLMASDIVEVIATRKTVFVYGTIEYIDTFKNKQTTNFRFRVGDAIGTSGGNIIYALQFMTKGNDST